MTNLDPTPKPAPRDDHDESLEPPMIFSYTRAQALADGVLVDVTSEVPHEWWTVGKRCKL